MSIPKPRYLLLLVAIAIPAAWLLARTTESENTSALATVERGDFEVTVQTSGELQALSAVEIKAPARAQEAGAFQMKIASIVPEGTIVAEGDLVANLDRSTLATRIQELNLSMQKATAVAEQAKLDTTLTLSKAREEIRNLKSAVEEKTLAKEQSVYEAPSVKRQVEIDLEKANRSLDQAQKDYITKEKQAVAKMQEVDADVQREVNKMEAVQDVMGQFTIMAPAPGMVIYRKEWNGKKRATGSQVSAWDPVVATLPDLTKMESITYVNEIDIKQVKVGQPVTLTLDADPTKQLTGKVTSVANVGEERPNTDAKVFEVRLVIDQADTTLRPGMTSGNRIQTLKRTDVLSVPIEAVNNDDGVLFVYLKRGGSISRQEIITGEINEDAVIVEDGLEEGDQVLLTPPADGMSMDINRLANSPVQPQSMGGDTAKGGVEVPKPSAAPDTQPPSMQPEN